VVQVLFEIQNMANLFLADPDGKSFASQRRPLIPQF
jgi:hypothetical protein